MNDEIVIGEIDYSILKSLTLDIKTLKDMVSILQIRSMVIEEHILFLIKKGLIEFQFENLTIASKGADIISKFEENYPGKSIDIYDFILNKIENKKKKRIKAYKLIDKILLISIIIIILYMLYIAKDLVM